MPIPFAAPIFVMGIGVFIGAIRDGIFMGPSPDAPPTTAGPETTDASQFFVLAGFAFSPVQIEQFFADAKSIYEKYKPVWVANEVTETTMYDTLQKLFKEFTTMVAVFPYFWNVCGVGLRQVEYFVILKIFGQSSLEGLAIKFCVKLTMFFLGLFEQMMCLLRG